MRHSDHHILILTTFLVAISMMALAAVVHMQQLPVRSSGDYLPSIHCLENPKIDSCSDRATGEIKPPSSEASHSIALILFIASCSLLLIWRVATLSDAKEREKIIVGILVAMILLASRFLFIN